MTTAAPTPAAVRIDELLRIEETDSAEFYVGELFRRQFGGAAPDYPRHFVAWYRAGRNVYAVVGYLHCTVIDELCLTGGLVEDERAIGRLPAPQRAELQRSGGVSARLLRHGLERFADKPALWAYVGEPRVRGMFLTAGFEPLAAPHLLARWNGDVPAAQRARLVDRVVALGAF